MYIREYMNPNVITVNSDTLIHNAEKIMRDHKIRRLPVVDKGKLVGIVTRDKIRRGNSISGYLSEHLGTQLSAS